ncbi:capsule biosynthesis protein [Eoetvoesiella caeni]|uniref:Capsule polysaccharide biosynthesis protein n=1 Tax=Eoetvoesiella caeni TaxID=645616 RepID=A0A366HIG6_9BURK|nr:capsule biosynthesis protein [Eoetvoesiella caeni]MCI2807800.1 hypothetical protein [Eoetvoesiella caeni]NYT54197.1 capsule biosynthesis protein [Eoetvoesiella caeni]RBP41716.1 hypothetical protein DFR37_10295 [Eoetvoesiella caeni]
MRIGFASIYSWRPHVGYMFFLAQLLQKAGHDVEFLTCDSDLPTCYTRQIRDIRPDWQECFICRAGGVRSYTGTNVSSLGQYKIAKAPLPDEWKDWTLSSASTLGRFESSADYNSDEFVAMAKKFEPVVDLAYRAAKTWIREKKLDALCIFNGRMDATRALFEAARDSKISVVSLERTWFGDGVQIYPEENCLGLGSVDDMMDSWRDKPLTSSQAKKSAGYISSRFLGQNNKEWRAYNTQSVPAPWPGDNGKRKILLIPGSINEIWGHRDWQSDWQHPTKAYDALISHLGLQANDLVLRCHPNWGETIGKRTGELPEALYTTWAKVRGIHVISSHDKTSTLGLIEQCDAIVVAGGSAALEAGALGKQIISVGPSVYQRAGMADDARDSAKLALLKLNMDLPPEMQMRRARAIARQTLRFCYTMTHRLPQYVDHVKAETTTQYLYKEGADPNRLLNILTTGRLEADDATYSSDSREETVVLDRLLMHDWAALREPGLEFDRDLYRPMTRRLLYKPIDSIRNKMPIGDR